MADKPPTGEIFGIPYSFEKPSFRRLVSSYWQPDEGMLTRKPFGIGYTLNLADWRSWVVLAVAGLLLLQQKRSNDTTTGNEEDDPVEVVVD
jgi:phosphatidylglycerophosphatase A